MRFFLSTSLAMCAMTAGAATAQTASTTFTVSAQVVAHCQIETGSAAAPDRECLQIRYLRRDASATTLPDQPRNTSDKQVGTEPEPALARLDGHAATPAPVVREWIVF